MRTYLERTKLRNLCVLGLPLSSCPCPFMSSLHFASEITCAFRIPTVLVFFSLSLLACCRWNPTLMSFVDLSDHFRSRNIFAHPLTPHEPCRTLLQLFWTSGASPAKKHISPADNNPNETSRGGAATASRSWLATPCMMIATCSHVIQSRLAACWPLYGAMPCEANENVWCPRTCEYFRYAAWNWMRQKV
ncbi:hypothetical protein K491DRAFT_179217 [Lophiostoma macrostomum CBS 122681]|uniref:Uncharacterized protein n=1 Tax=Lophiostoma macrostomum CBS 122681 TaxID=1314788 RepID=A0A6A6TU21_9PLEO|nr:hypothetical protein K491DRAFT_179217 [Lophiostoma macrostomum CBS 122681]